MSPPVWGPFPPEWGPAPSVAYGTLMEPWGIDNVARWIDACEAADRARGVVRGTEARAAVAARAAPVTQREGMSGWQARAATEARRAPADGEPGPCRVRHSPRGRMFSGEEAAAMLEARDFKPVTRPGEIGRALALQWARHTGRRGHHAN